MPKIFPLGSNSIETLDREVVTLLSSVPGQSLCLIHDLVRQHALMIKTQYKKTKDPLQRTKKLFLR